MDELSKILTAIGHNIAEHGCDATSDIERLVEVARPFAPVAAAVLESDSSPEVTRSRAFLHIALAAEELAAADRHAVASILAQSVDPTVEVARPEPVAAGRTRHARFAFMPRPASA